MNTKLALFVASSDSGDGSVLISIHNSEQEALDRLERTLEQIEEGNYYDDGTVREIILEITPENKLTKPVRFNTW